MRLKVFLVSWCFLTLTVAISSSSDENLMTDMTEAVFGTQTSRNIFPMAFLGKSFSQKSLFDLLRYMTHKLHEKDFNQLSGKLTLLYLKGLKFVIAKIRYIL